MALADKIVVMRDGAIICADTPEGIYENPPNLFVAGYVGLPPMNLFEATVVKDDGRVFLTVGADVSIPLDGSRAEALKNSAGSGIIVGVRPEDARLASPDTAPPRFSAHELDVMTAEYLGADAFLRLRLDNDIFSARVKPSELSKAGEKVKIAIDTEKIYLFNIETEETITFEKT
jgi:multiple sugar transport system ATP-binding protein